MGKNIKKVRKIENWMEMMDSLKKKIQKLNEKPALVVFRERGGEVKGFLNSKALDIIAIDRKCKYIRLIIYSFPGSGVRESFMELTAKDKQDFPAYQTFDEKGGPIEPGSGLCYSFSKLEDNGCFKVGDRLNADFSIDHHYFPGSFEIYFLNKNFFRQHKEVYPLKEKNNFIFQS